MRVWALVWVAVLLAGCSKPASQMYSDEKLYARKAPSPAVAADAGPDTDASDQSEAKTIPAPSAAASMLAYSYKYGLEAPPSNIRPLLAKHEAACAAAGIAVCQVTGSNVEATGKDSVDATLSLRAAPAWLTKFQAAIAEDAKSAGGRVFSATVTSEDLSREIVDEEATVKAKTALRDRLQAILQTRPGKTSDLVEAETALSKVQGELDAGNSELAVARQRVATSDITIEYKSAGVFAPEGTWAPLTAAIKGFVGTVVIALAVMVQVFAILLPWVVVIVVVGWLFRKRLSKAKWPWRREPKPTSPPES